MERGSAELAAMYLALTFFLTVLLADFVLIVMTLVFSADAQDWSLFGQTNNYTMLFAIILTLVLNGGLAVGMLFWGWKTFDYWKKQPHHWHFGWLLRSRPRGKKGGKKGP
jgi:hypothetical protein